ncbi:MAG: CCxxC motif-containing NuoF prefix domain-containing protein, partial [Ignavibacteriae bacterium]|nr:CCxxC motif-containing NuoF prefix domain-containing protein [Ignavibacteriota bacterium]
MNTFIDICCSECWHTYKKPCNQFVKCCTEGPLCHHNTECAKKFKDLNNILTYKIHDLPVIIIGKGTCGLAAGAQKVEDAIRAELAKLNIKAQIETTGCVGYCAQEPIVDIKLPGGERISYCQVTPKMVSKLIKKTLVDKDILKENVLGTYGKSNGEVKNINEIPFFKNQLKIVLENCGVVNPTSIDAYIAAGGFKALDKVLNLMKPEEVVKDILASGLRGRGGGGFPTGRKWDFALKQKSDTKYIICNADEGDPGAFMDRSVLESDPYKVVEGMLIGGYAICASLGYIYCRAEYPLAITRLEETIASCKKYGLLGENILGSSFTFNLKIKKGAGAFVCGEETALIASIEGKRGMPKPRPPYPAVAGLWGKPTVINNVETFANVPQILKKGADYF